MRRYWSSETKENRTAKQFDVYYKAFVVLAIMVSPIIYVWAVCIEKSFPVDFLMTLLSVYI